MAKTAAQRAESSRATKTTPAAANAPSPAGGESFAAMLEQSFGESGSLEGSVVKGVITAIDKEHAMIDVGLKSEGRVALREFGLPGQPAELKIGDIVEVFLERMENRDGEAMLSRDKAKREESWTVLQQSFDKGAHVTGIIFGRVKGGFTVDLSGATAFLPGSQVDIRPVKDITRIDGHAATVSRSSKWIVRAATSSCRAAPFWKKAAPKHVRNSSPILRKVRFWPVSSRTSPITAPSSISAASMVCCMSPTSPGSASTIRRKCLQIGQQVTVQIIRFNQETQRISLGMKQLEADPWEGVAAKYPAGLRMKGRVTNITDYGAFVELEPGIEGLVHVSEMSWTKKNVHPGKIVSTSQEVEVAVLDIDMQKRRISLGIKQCVENPWESFGTTHKVGDILSGEIRNITEFGLFIGMTGDIDGMVHMSDIDWGKPGEEAIKDYQKGQNVQVKILDIDAAKERVSLGIKQLTSDPFESVSVNFKKGDVVTCTVSAVGEHGIEVTLGEAGSGFTGFIKRGDLSRDRSEQRADRFAVGEKVDAKITNIDKGTRKVGLSIKARETDEEKQAMAEFGSSDSGASLGDILGAAIKKAQKKDEAKE